MVHPQTGGPVEHCQHERVTHRHGTVAAYCACACRCRACTDAARDNRRAIRAAYRTGAWYPTLVSAEPVVEYLTAIHDAGMSADAMVAVSGVPRRTICGLLWPATGITARRIRRDNAEALLAIRCGDRRVPANLLIPVAGTRRRVEALARLGWGKDYLGARLGITAQAVSWCIGPHKRGITAGRAHAVADLYTEMSESLGPSRVVERRAESAGWAAPWQWDGIDIDDPRAVPLPDVVVANELTGIAAKVDMLADLIDTHHPSWTEAAEHLGVVEETIRRWTCAADRRDLADQLTANTRRRRGVEAA